MVDNHHFIAKEGFIAHAIAAK
ncbi:hypothetical protein DXJ58_10775 [Vibrio fluvialis]|nr:hypothetical protein [Vibrio fluvialis]